MPDAYGLVRQWYGNLRRWTILASALLASTSWIWPRASSSQSKGPCLLTHQSGPIDTNYCVSSRPEADIRLEMEAAPVTKTERFRLPSAPLSEAQGEAAAGIIGIGLLALVGAVGRMQPRPTRTAQSASRARLLSRHVRCCGCVVKLIIPRSE
jgi:hypothetical protein